MEHLAKLSNEVVHFSLGLLQLAQFLVCGLGQWPQVLVMVLDHSLKVTVEFQKCTCGYDLSLVVSIDRSLGLSERIGFLAEARLHPRRIRDIHASF
jgi:hypothetical protein